jgi:superfamily II DNA helicase RecQ
LHAYTATATERVRADIVAQLTLRDPTILIGQYVRGETLIEAYWKSVAWPGQGVFIGEPLAAPYKRNR